MKFVIFALLMVLLAGGAFIAHKRFNGAPIGEPPVAVKSVATRLKNLEGTNKHLKLPLKERELLIEAVEYFCVGSYHRDSCLHYLITCGAPCLVSVPREYRRRILDDYRRVRAERGLPPVKNLSEMEE